jgi:malic enzyme
LVPVRQQPHDDLLVALGARRDKLYMLDRQGVIHSGREGLDPHKLAFANDSGARTLTRPCKAPMYSWVFLVRTC